MNSPSSKNLTWLTRFWPLLAVVFFVAALLLAIPKIQMLSGWELFRTDSVSLLSKEQAYLKILAKLSTLPEDNSERLKTREALAALYLAQRRFDSAQDIYLDVLRIKTAHKQNLQEINLALAELYRYMGDFPKAERYYKKVWDCDKEHLDKNDARIIRDLSNQGVICYLIAMSTDDKLVRELELNRANFFLIQAEITCRDGPKHDLQDEANLWDNRALVARELGNINEATALKERARVVHEKMPNRLIPP